MSWNKRLWRLARKLESAYRTERSQQGLQAPAAWAWERVRATQRRHAVAEQHHWSYAAARERERLALDLETLLGQLRTLRNSLEGPHLRRQPEAAELYAELVAAEEEFGGVTTEDNEVYVTTEPITLEDVYLGPFEIRLDLARLAEQEPFRLVALEPHPAASCSATAHPHVHHEKPCLGEGKPAIAAALAEGRLGDLFLLIDRVLHTYGAGSAYVELDQWHGVPCRDCGDGVDEDDACTCGSCEAELCSGCARSCTQCGSDRCSDCALSCARCEETTCSGCLHACEHCEEEFCAHCHSEGVCDACRESLDEEEEDETDSGEEDVCVDEVGVDDVDEESEPMPEPAVHAVGLGQTPVSPRPRQRRSRRLRNLGRSRSPVG